MRFPIRVRASALIMQNDAILLVEFNNKTGLHYNLPGGGVDPGESIVEGLRREVKEETCADVVVGDVAFVLEYEPKRNQFWAGDTHSLTLIFACQLIGSVTPRLPERPDPNQTAVKWVSLSALPSVELLPHFSDKLIAFATGQARPPIFWDEPLSPERIQRYLPN